MYSSLTTLYPDNVNFAVSSFEMSNGIGFSFGPAIGSILYSLGGYDFPFYCFMLVILASTATSFLMIPQYMNQSPPETGGETEVSLLDLMKNRRILFACII